MSPSTLTDRTVSTPPRWRGYPGCPCPRCKMSERAQPTAPTPAADPCAQATTDTFFVDAELPYTVPDELNTGWVFAYGSLIWNPEFEFEERIKARINGYHRAFCINSHVYRGTPEEPGVVLGLDAGGHCEGIVYRFKAGHEFEIANQIYNREMLNEVYQPRLLDVELPDGRQIRVLTFVADQNDTHGYLAGPRTEVLRRLRECQGCRGSNREYALNTQAALREWGIEDSALDALLAEMDA